MNDSFDVEAPSPHGEFADNGACGSCGGTGWLWPAGAVRAVPPSLRKPLRCECQRGGDDG